MIDIRIATKLRNSALYNINCDHFKCTCMYNCCKIYVDHSSVGYTAEFFSKCWFGRFTSWSSQTMPEEVVSRQREKRQARALPSR